MASSSRPSPRTPFPLGYTAEALQWSPDGALIAAVDNGGGGSYRGGYLVVWDAHSGDVRYKLPIDTSRDSYPAVQHVIFTRDSKGLVVSYDTGLVETLSTATWTVVKSTQLNASVFGVDSLAFIGFNPDGSELLAVGGYGNDGGNASLLWLDAATLETTKTVEHAHTGSVKSMAVSPDGTLMATGASDGILRVWDTKTGDLRQQLDFGGSEVQGVAFIDNLHLAVTPRRGDLLIMTLDPGELANAVRASLTRTFTGTECKTYGIDPCPTLADMRAP